MALPLQPALAAHLPEVVTTMAGRTQRLQVGAGTHENLLPKPAALGPTTKPARATPPGS